jgi:hypothetical protein
LSSYGRDIILGLLVSWKGLSPVSSCDIKKQALSRGFVVRNSGGWKVMLAHTMYLQLQLAVQQYHQHEQLQQQQDQIHVEAQAQVQVQVLVMA